MHAGLMWKIFYTLIWRYFYERKCNEPESKDKKSVQGKECISTSHIAELYVRKVFRTTVKNYPISADSLTKAISEICNIEIPDDVVFSFSGIEPIRDDDMYGGYRVLLKATYDTIVTPLSIDITTGDAITPHEVLYLYKMIFEKSAIGVWAYNLETVLAEKVETILNRGELNTRPRDFYDVYILVNTQKFDGAIFAEALKETVNHRNTAHIFSDIRDRIEIIRSSRALRDRWTKYSENYMYAKDIAYENTVDALVKLIGFLS